MSWVTFKDMDGDEPIHVNAYHVTSVKPYSDGGRSRPPSSYISMNNGEGHHVEGLHTDILKKLQ